MKWRNGVEVPENISAEYVVFFYPSYRIKRCFGAQLQESVEDQPLY